MASQPVDVLDELAQVLELLHPLLGDRAHLVDLGVLLAQPLLGLAADRIGTTHLGLQLLDALLHLDVLGDARLEAGDLFRLGGDVAGELGFAALARAHLQALQHVHDRHGDQRDRHDQQQSPQDLDDRLGLHGVDGDLVRIQGALSCSK